MPLPADSEKSCTWKFSVHSSSYLTKARRIGKTPGRIGIQLVEGQQHRNDILLSKKNPVDLQLDFHFNHTKDCR